MINIEALDKIIAVVVVVLTLCLFVQSLQALLKKMFKIKSLQIETSLTHLCHYMLEKDTINIVTSRISNSPFLRMITFRSKHPAEHDDHVKALYDVVEKGFRRLGRVTASGKMMLDSISKGDLKKILENVQLGDLLDGLVPGSVNSLDEVQKRITTLEANLQQAKSAYEALSAGPDSPFNQVEQIVTSIINNARGIFAGNNVEAKTLVTDLAKLKDIAPESLVKVREQIKLLKAGLSGPTATAAITALTTLDAQLEKLETVVKVLGSIDGSIAKMETWYDTVMQSFEERYARSMKTWTWVISALVVIFLNANLINIYRDISTGDAKRAVILQVADKIRDIKKSPADATKTPEEAAITPEQWIAESKKVINDNLDAYIGMGFGGPKWIGEVGDWWKGAGNYTDPERQSWGFGFERGLKTLLGWLVMTMLLSAGAPFWQDALESLFGVKNLLRTNTGTRNVETASGAGQPKP